MRVEGTIYTPHYLEPLWTRSSKSHQASCEALCSFSPICLQTC